MTLRLRLWHLLLLASLSVLALDRMLPSQRLHAWIDATERRTGLPGFNALFYQHPASRPGDWLIVSNYFDLCLHRQIWFDTLHCAHIRDAAAARALLLDQPRTRFAILRPADVARWFPDGDFDRAYVAAFASDGFTFYERR